MIWKTNARARTLNDSVRLSVCPCVSVMYTCDCGRVCALRQRILVYCVCIVTVHLIVCAYVPCVCALCIVYVLHVSAKRENCINRFTPLRQRRAKGHTRWQCSRDRHTRWRCRGGWQSIVSRPCVSAGQRDTRDGSQSIHTSIYTSTS